MTNGVRAAPNAHLVRAVAEELRIRRELAGAEVDEVIAAAVAAKLVEDERQRRADWKCREHFATLFNSLGDGW